MAKKANNQHKKPPQKNHIARKLEELQKQRSNLVKKRNQHKGSKKMLNTLIAGYDGRIAALKKMLLKQAKSPSLKASSKILLPKKYAQGVFDQVIKLYGPKYQQSLHAAPGISRDFPIGPGLSLHLDAALELSLNAEFERAGDDKKNGVKLNSSFKSEGYAQFGLQVGVHQFAAIMIAAKSVLTGSAKTTLGVHKAYPKSMVMISREPLVITVNGELDVVLKFDFMNHIADSLVEKFLKRLSTFLPGTDVDGTSLSYDLGDIDLLTISLSEVMIGMSLEKRHLHLTDSATKPSIQVAPPLKEAFNELKKTIDHVLHLSKKEQQRPPQPVCSSSGRL